MYRLMKSAPTDDWNENSNLRAYDQEEVAQYANLAEAVAACDDANHLGETRHYVVDDSGREYYAGSWID
jgi:hypothetical protein